MTYLGDSLEALGHWQFNTQLWSSRNTEVGGVNIQNINEATDEDDTAWSLQSKIIKGPVQNTG